MLTFEDAVEKAKKYVEELGRTAFKRTDLVLIASHVRHYSRGWVFPYNTKRYTETKVPLDGLVGNRPIFVDQLDGSAHLIPTGSIDQWVINYTQVHQKVG